MTPPRSAVLTIVRASLLAGTLDLSAAVVENVIAVVTLIVCIGIPISLIVSRHHATSKNG